MEPNNAQMDIATLEKTYDRYSSFYDALFGTFFSPGRAAVVKGLQLEDDAHILEIGIGTGASLELYPEQTKITGVDLSEDMLSLSERRAHQGGRAVDLRLMNAEKMDFPDNSFSHVVAMYVVSVSPDPAAIVREMVRVCKPGGELVILNHFSEEDTLVGRLERVLAPLSSRLGFKPYFPLNEFTEQCSPFAFDERSKTNLLGYWSILKGRKR